MSPPETPLAPFGEEHASLARRHRAAVAARRSRMSPLRCCVGFCAILGLAALGTVTFIVVGLARDWSGIAASPHRAVHANPAVVAGTSDVRALEPTVVRSLFGRGDVGSIGAFNLKAAIWVRTSNRLKDPDAPWELVYEDVVLRDVKVDSKAVHASPRVHLSKDVLARLRTRLTRLHATFVMLPSPSSLDPAVDYHSWRTARNASSHSIHGPLPPVNIDDADLPVEGAFRDFLSNSACTTPILKHRIDSATGEVATSENTTALYIRRKAFVTMVADFPVYNLTGFQQSMTQLAASRREECIYGTFGGQHCVRKFSRDGHFENLIEFDDARAGEKATATRMGWRYAPFITNALGYAGPLDHVEVPLAGSTGEEDFSFDWHISWAPVPPTRFEPAIAMAGGMPSDTLPANKTDYSKAQGQDMADIFLSAFGHSVRENARPGLRAVVRLFQTLCFLFGSALDMHYWYTRSLGTGITLPLEVLDDLWSVVNSVSTTFFGKLAFDGDWFMHVLHGLASLTTLWKLVLLLRLEFCWGGPLNWLPVGVSRRRYTHSERASARADLLFNWKSRFLAIVVFTLAYRFSNRLPHLVTANPPTIGTLQTTDPHHLWKTIAPFLGSASSAISLVKNLAQIHLNYRLQSFGGTYRCAAVLGLVFDLLEHAPTVLVNIFGTWELRSPIRVEHAVGTAVAAVGAWQAVRYRAVPQVEEEEE
ncbi:hypothetical protein JCM10450v2_003238 [Rhodotorula kratochvilovae]